MMGSRFGADLAYFESLPLGKWFFLLSVHQKAVDRHNRELSKSRASGETETVYSGDLVQ